MSFDQHRNFAVSLVAAAPSPATSGTTLTVTAAQGARFPSVAPFPVVVCPAAAQPTPENAEIATCTARAGDVLTLTRAAEGTTARTILVGDQVWAGPTVKTFTDIETQVAALDPPGSAAAAQSAAAADATAKVAAEAAARATAITGQHTADVALFDAAGAATAAQTAAAADATGKVATETTARTAADALLIPLTQRAAASGVATLDSGSKIPAGQVPDLSGTYALSAEPVAVAEAANRATAVTAEASTRATADTTLQTNITNEASTARAAESAAQSTANAAAPKLTVVARTTAYTPARGEIVLCDTTGGTFAVTVPAASGGKGRVAMKWTAGSTAPTFALTGSDHLNTSGGPTSGTLTLTNQSATFDSDGTSVWVVSSGDLPLSGLDARYPLTSALAALGTGLVKSTTGTGALTIAAAADVPNLAESQVTNLTTDLAAKVPLSTVTAAADLIVGTGTGAVTRLGKGTALQTLRVNAAATALEYATPVAAKSAATRAYTRQNWR